MASAAPAVRSDLLVSTAWLGQHLNNSNIVILQVSRDHTAYDAGRIPGARFLALSDVLVTRDGLLNELPPAAGLKSVFERLRVSDDSRVILYGNALVLPATRAYFNAVKNLSYTALNAPSASPVLLDARTVGEFAGNNAASSEIPRPSHIPGATNVLLDADASQFAVERRERF